MTSYAASTSWSAPAGRRRCWHLMTGHESHRRHWRHRGGAHGMHGFLGRGPRASRGDIRTAILVLLAEQPMHGYQIITELRERSDGVWRPSPGSIYPTLQLMQDEGLLRSQEDEAGRRVFQLTEAGRAAAPASGERAPWEEVASEGDASAIELRDLMFGVIAAARQVRSTGDAAQISQAKDVLSDARRSLYRILAAEATTSESDSA
jgi:DNA-binding PadR family transcriptional regulator